MRGVHIDRDGLFVFESSSTVRYSVFSLSRLRDVGLGMTYEDGGVARLLVCVPW